MFKNATDDEDGLFYSMGVIGSVVSYFATLVFLCATISQDNFPKDCILDHQGGAKWLIISVIPSIIPIIFCTITLFCCLPLIIFLIFATLANSCRELYNKGDFCCFHIVEELEVV